MPRHGTIINSMTPSKKDQIVILSALGAMLLIAFSGLFIYAKFEYDPLKPRYFTTGSEITRRQPLQFDAILTPSTATQAIDYSNAGFATITSITITPENNTGTVTSMPLASIKTWSTTGCTVNILQSNSQVVSILGATVSGLATATNLASMKLHIHVEGW